MEDYLQIGIGKSPAHEVFGQTPSRSWIKQPRRLRYSRCYSYSLPFEGGKASLKIPLPPRRISKLERLLAVIMSPSNRRAASAHGLVGKPLL